MVPQQELDEGADCVCVEPVALLMRSVRFSKPGGGLTFDLSNEEYDRTRRVMNSTSFLGLAPVTCVGALKITLLGGDMYKLSRHDDDLGFAVSKRALRALFSGIRFQQRYGRFPRAAVANQIIVNNMTPVDRGFLLGSGTSSDAVEMSDTEYVEFAAALPEVDLEDGDDVVQVGVLLLANRLNGCHLIMRADGTSSTITVSTASLLTLQDDSRRAKKFGKQVVAFS